MTRDPKRTTSAHAAAGSADSTDSADSAENPAAVHTDNRVLPSETEPAAVGFLRFLNNRPRFTSGATVGQHARIGAVAGRWTPRLVLLITAAVFLVFSWLQKASCLRTGHGDDGSVFINWAGNRQYTTACYNDQIALFSSRGLDELHFPYLYSWESGGELRFMEYPVLSGLYQYVAAAVARPVQSAWDWLGLPAAPAAVFYFAVSCAGLALCWLIAVRLMTGLTGNRVWDTVLMAASPLVIVHAFTNFDLLSIVFAVACVSAWANRRPGLAGVLGGLGVAAKLWPAFILGAIVLLCLRARAWAPMVRLFVGAVVAWLAVNVPIMIVAPQGWGEFFRLNSTRGWEGSTVYAVIAHIVGSDAWDGTTPSKAIEGIGALNVITFVLLVVCLVALAWFVVFFLKTPPRLGQVVFLAVLAFMLTNKVWSPQYSIWLVPLLVLALPRWRLVFTWAAVEAGYWYLRMWQFLPEGEAAPVWLVDSVTVLRVGLLVAMAVIVVRDMLQPRRDVIRAAHGGRDPLAGALAGPLAGAVLGSSASVEADTQRVSSFHRVS